MRPLEDDLPRRRPRWGVRRVLVVAACACAAAVLLGAGPPAVPSPYVVVLGIAQDAGHPQAECAGECCASAFNDPSSGHSVASLGIVDPASGERWLIDATPDFPRQLRSLNELVDGRGAPDGILLTHAHVGHYTGLMHLGREAMGAADAVVHVMPKMKTYLSGNGPWSQLVRLGNIRLAPMADGRWVRLNERVRVRPFVVPHRDEFSETVGFVVEAGATKVAWLPDIDKWSTWRKPVEELVAEVDVAWIDGTFFGDGEVRRDMAEIPHPFIVESMQRLGALSAEARAKVRFVHFNHSNPVLNDVGPEAEAVRSGGFGLAAEGDRVELR